MDIDIDVNNTTNYVNPIMTSQIQMNPNLYEYQQQQQQQQQQCLNIPIGMPIQIPIPIQQIPIPVSIPLNHFGIVVPGRPVLTEFQQISECKCISFINDPCSVAEITFFLVPSSPIPQGYGAILYYALPPFENWEIIGTIDPSKPSGTFRTGWSTNEEFYGSTIVQLGISLETIDNINNLEIMNNGVENRLAFAHKIALDLFQYMTSFSTPNPASNQMMVVPINIFDKWMERFDRKYKLDPNFMMKQSV